MGHKSIHRISTLLTADREASLTVYVVLLALHVNDAVVASSQGPDV